MVRRTVRIAGAGIAGLALATALGRRGWHVAIHEQAPVLREIGAGITLGPDGIESLKTLGAFEETVADGRRVERWSMYDERNRTVQGQDVTQLMFCCHRRSLHRALARTARAAGAEILAGSRVLGADDGALLLADRAGSPSPAYADLVVGADGVGSRVRRSLGESGLQIEMNDLNVSGLRYVLPHRSTEWLGSQPEWLRDSRRVGILPLGGADLAVFLSCRSDDARARTFPLDPQHWVTTFPEAEDLIRRAPVDAQWRELVEVRCSRWSFGTAALVGDSAFAMASNLGTGAVSALRAAVSMAEEVSDTADLERALGTWEQRVRPFIEYNQSWSRRYNRLATTWPESLSTLRSATYWLLGHSPSLNRRFAGV